MTAACSSCSGPIARGSRSGRCRRCVFPLPPPRFCDLCSSLIARHNKSGVCKPCHCRLILSNPAINAKRLSRLAESNRDPAINKRRVRAMIAYSRTPEGRKQRSEAGKKNAPSTIHSSHAKAKAWAPEAKAARITAQKATWASKRDRAALREAMAGLTPFERAMLAVKNGAGIVEVPPIRRADPAYTLAGVYGEINL